MIEWAVWGILLVLQNAAHTASSRARNSTSLWYSSTVSVFSNGVWFASQFYIVNQLVLAKSDPVRFSLVMAFYIGMTVAGSTLSHWYFMRWEKRKGIQRG